jgi:hypothetical protein
VRRSAELTVDDEGNVEGDVHLVFEGQEALLWRLDARNEDDAQRRKNLEDWLKATLPDNSQSTLISSDGWTKSDGPVTATLHVQTHGYANQLGQRLLLRLGYFKTFENKSFFCSAHRTHPVYFRFPSLTISYESRLPRGSQLRPRLLHCRLKAALRILT